MSGSFAPAVTPIEREQVVTDCLSQLIASFEGPSEVERVETVIPSDLAQVSLIQEEIERLLESRGYAGRDLFAIRLSLEEALVNAVKHGNQFDRGKQVYIAYRVTDDQFEITIEDEGPGFNADEVADPLAFENLERPCGRGLLLMRRYMSVVVFHPPGNKVTLRKDRSHHGGDRNA